MTPVSVDRVETVEQLWAEYKAVGDRATRDRLILHYSPLVKFVSGRVLSRLPDTLDGADLVSYGILGLIDAIEKFDPERGFKFETYAVPRIRGAILDELRSIDWVPRSVAGKGAGRRSGLHQARAQVAALAHRRGAGGRARHLPAGARRPAAPNHPRQRAPAGRGPLHRWAGVPHARRHDRRQRRGSGARLELQETRRLVARAIASLADRERTVLTLYYYERLNLSEIGEILGVTESRACQIHTKAVHQLRHKLRDQIS